MINIEKYLREGRPDISDSTVRAYTVSLHKLHDRLCGTREFESIEWLRDSDAVMGNLNKHCVSYLTRRNYLNAVIVLLLGRAGFEPALEAYQAQRDKYNDQYVEMQQTKEPSAKQAANWVSVAEIEELIGEYDIEVKDLRSQTDLTPKELTVFQDRFMLLFWLNYPMRNDLHTTRVIGKRAFNALDQNDKDNKNYVILGKQIVLSIGNYKTRKKYGVKKIGIEQKRVVKAMKQWLAVSPNPEYILVNTKNGGPMSSLQITQNLTRIFKKSFGKSVGSTLLRHIVLTEKFGKQLEEMESMADMMAHDVSTAHKIYIKKVDEEDSDGSSS
eukprot:COSAG04_NODE_3724_length_2581_cov_76.628928_2_plen_328_part_00